MESIDSTFYGVTVINARTYKQTHTPTVVQVGGGGGGVDGPPLGFRYVTIF